MVVDTLGLVLEVEVQAANVQDREGAKELLVPVAMKYWRLKRIWADGNYRGEFEKGVGNLRQGRGRGRIQLEIVSKTQSMGFVVLPKRWIVERTFGWWGRSRRLSKDYEALCETSRSWILIAMLHLMVKRLARVSSAF